jgi:hypothetical protein
MGDKGKKDKDKSRKQKLANNALHLTAIPPRCIAAGELCR